MIKYKFLTKKDKEFSAALRQRVNEYFQENNLSRNANARMVIKSVAVFAWYLVPYLVILFAGITNLYVLMGLWIMMGLGKTFIGTTVMHDAIHGSYSHKRWINKAMSFSAAVIGVDRLIWHIQHNVIHHTYTNIEDTDEDILPRIVFRFSKHQPRYWFHRFQHIYAPLFYCVPLLEWITTKDFVKAFEYKGLKLIKSGAKFWATFGGIFFRKALYYALFLIPPLFLVGIPVWMTITMILVSHGVTGIMLAMIFQTAHVVPDAKFIKEETEKINQSWIAHQLYTTVNYGMKQPILTWLLGGLNFQIEHHLFPEVCHVHYKSIAPIVQETAKEFDLPYQYEETFGNAVASHFSMLKALGRPNYVPKVQASY
jgi:linoleoyl-CoA desaturase